MTAEAAAYVSQFGLDTDTQFSVLFALVLPTSSKPRSVAGSIGIVKREAVNKTNHQKQTQQHETKQRKATSIPNSTSYVSKVPTLNPPMRKNGSTPRSTCTNLGKPRSPIDIFKSEAIATVPITNISATRYQHNAHKARPDM